MLCLRTYSTPSTMSRSVRVSSPKSGLTKVSACRSEAAAVNVDRPMSPQLRFRHSRENGDRATEVTATKARNLPSQVRIRIGS